MNLFCAFVRNVTALPGLESVHRFKTLSLAAKFAGCLRGCEVDFVDAFAESFSLRETGHAVSLRAFAAPTALQTSAVWETGADVQIGGGVRVGDAFQAIVRLNLIAM